MRFSFATYITALCLFLSGCQVPVHMQVRHGKAPANIDTDVRFRTVYYFRVFDFCRGKGAAAENQPEAESLYRFVMTGKANAYANRVRFESGTLKSYQIDPFGANIERNETGEIRFVSVEEKNARARQNLALNNIDRLIEFRDKLDGEDGNKNGSLLTSLDTQIERVISESVAASFAPLSSGNASIGTPSNNAPAICNDGTQVQRGFQILGPQGIKTFDQEDRLILAMTSDAQPLISTLEQTSGRILETRKRELSQSDLLLPLITEQLRVTKINLVQKSDNDIENTRDFIGELADLLREDMGDES